MKQAVRCAAVLEMWVLTVVPAYAVSVAAFSSAWALAFIAVSDYHNHRGGVQSSLQLSARHSVRALFGLPLRGHSICKVDHLGDSQCPTSCEKRKPLYNNLLWELPWNNLLTDNRAEGIRATGGFAIMFSQFRVCDVSIVCGTGCRRPIPCTDVGTSCGQCHKEPL